MRERKGRKMRPFRSGEPAWYGKGSGFDAQRRRRRKVSAGGLGDLLPAKTRLGKATLVSEGGSCVCLGRDVRHQTSAWRATGAQLQPAQITCFSPLNVFTTHLSFTSRQRANPTLMPCFTPIAANSSRGAAAWNCSRPRQQASPLLTKSTTSQAKRCFGHWHAVCGKSAQDALPPSSQTNWLSTAPGLLRNSPRLSQPRATVRLTRLRSRETGTSR